MHGVTKLIAITLILLFAFVSNASAYDMCCEIFSSTEASCHDGTDTELHSSDSDQEDDCEMCKSGHCKSHSHMSLVQKVATFDTPQKVVSAIQVEQLNQHPTYGVDIPPKSIS